MNMFLSLRGSHMQPKVKGKRVNRGEGLEVSCNYCLIGQEKAIEWVKKKIAVILKEHRAVVQKLFRKLVNK